MAQLKYWDGTQWVPLYGSIGASAPTGTIAGYGGTIPPTGWLLCDGTVYLNTAWPALAAIIGNTYGGVAGTSFAVPDLRSRMHLGSGQGAGLTNHANGATGGSEAIGAHTHTIRSFVTTGAPNAMNRTDALSAGAGNASSEVGFPSGSAGTFDNLPPFLAAPFIIKAAGGGEQPLAPDMVGATSVAVPMIGPWPGAVPTAVQGTAFTTPAGVLRGTASATNWTANGATTAMQVGCYVDGVLVGTMQVVPGTASLRQATSTITFSMTVTAGTHYVYFRLVSGSTDGGDVGHFFGVVTPATGSLVEPATVLNLRKAANQSIPADTWTAVTTWEKQHSYPVWGAESGFGEYTVPADGYYRVEFNWMGDPSTTTRAAGIAVNGVRVSQANAPPAGTNSHGTTAVWVETNLKAGDKVGFNVYSTVAGNLYSGNVAPYTAGTYVTRAIIRKIYSGGIPGGSGAPDIPWTPLALVNGWVDYGSGFEPSGYCRRGGVVYLRGLIRGGTVTSGTIITTLPAGCRSAGGTTHVIVATGVPSWAFLNVGDDGTVKCNSSVNAGWLSLRGISYPADA